MQKITFIRTMIDIFTNNAIVKTITEFVNFCNEQRYFGQKNLKFLKKMPINKLEPEHTNRYLFGNVNLKMENGKLL